MNLNDNDDLLKLIYQKLNSVPQPAFIHDVTYEEIEIAFGTIEQVHQLLEVYIEYQNKNVH